jgi:hypothetical protein
MFANRVPTLTIGVSAALSLFLAVTPVARGQCMPEWLPGEHPAGLGGPAYAVATWDPDGDGPQAALLIVGGGFGVASDVLASNIAS